MTPIRAFSKVANQDALKGHEGHHVKLEGSAENDTLTAPRVSMLPDQTNW